METSAWMMEDFTYPVGIPTMLTGEETRYLHWLSRTCWDGQGEIMEIGPWLGGSTACLAAGMAASGHPLNGKLNVYDNFLWRSFMAKRAPLDLQPGDSFQAAFEANLEPWKDALQVFAMSLPDEVIAGDRVARGKRAREEEQVPVFADQGEGDLQILFIDGAKSWRGMAFLLKSIHRRLVAGKSLLVCQDFKYWGCYWVPLMMGRMKTWLEPVHHTPSATTVTFQLAESPDPSWLEALEDSVEHISTEEGLEAIEACADLLKNHGDQKGMRWVGLAQVAFLCHQGHSERAKRVFLDLQEQWPSRTAVGFLEEARNYLQQEHGLNLPRPMRFTAGKLANRIMGAPRY